MAVEKRRVYWRRSARLVSREEGPCWRTTTVHPPLVMPAMASPSFQ